MNILTRYQGYFPTPAGEKLTEDEVYIGGLLLHFLELLQFNAHEVAQFEQVINCCQLLLFLNNLFIYE